MSADLWQKCAAVLQTELSQKEFNTWLANLESQQTGSLLRLYAANRFIHQWVMRKYLERISELIRELSEGGYVELELMLGRAPTVVAESTSTPEPQQRMSRPRDAQAAQLRTAQLLSQTGAKVSVKSRTAATQPMAEPDDAVDFNTEDDSHPVAVVNDTVVQQEVHRPSRSTVRKPKPQREKTKQVDGALKHESYLNPDYTFDNFVPGPSNELAHSAAKQVITTPGTEYNPLYIYGPTGLGKTHLMHAIGNHMLKENPHANILYVHSERFFQDMVKAIQSKSSNEFKRYYRSVDLLMIDDVQFFGGKKGTMDEFFHTFNALLEGKQQIVLTSDRFAKDIEGLEERLKSRFNWGLSVCIEPPELELRVAILQKKALQSNINLDDESALFIAQRIRSNVRELEGALKAVVAKANFKKRSQMNVAFVQDALKDMLASHDKQVSIDNIQRVVAEFYGLSITDLVSKRRTSNLVKPRHIAMALSKELTNHSLPEIGRAFGNRDHSTVLHANRKVEALILESREYADNYKHLKRIIGG